MGIRTMEVTEGIEEVIEELREAWDTIICRVVWVFE